jgi:RNA recognition motif-containing protein
MGNRIYVGNVSFHATSDSLRETFAECGEVLDVHIVQERETGQSRGFAFVTMATDAEAAGAISKLNGSMLDNRQLRLSEAEERQKRSDGAGARGGRRF